MAARTLPLTSRTLLGLSLLAALAACGGPAAPQAAAPASAVALASAPVAAGGEADRAGFDGVVQAVRQTAIAAQVSGAVVALNVKAGDTVKAGQVLLRLDARAAQQAAAAGSAQVLAARAMQDAATKEYERQKQLYASHFISRAALDQAEAQYKASQAQAQAQLASAGAAQTESTFYVVRAPYDGVVADVPVVLGDMAMPGRPLLTVYDPAALRVSAPVPQTVAAALPKGAAIEVEVPGAVDGRLAPARVQLLPTVDPSTHTLELRADLPPGLSGVTPGMFARAWLPGGGAEGRLYVPQRAVVRHAELTAVYVIAPDGRALLRQVRLGRGDGERIEVLSGLSAGERVALEPQAAARAVTVPPGGSPPAGSQGDRESRTALRG